MTGFEKSKWITLVQEVKARPKKGIDWKSLSELTKVGAVATVALFAGLVLNGAIKKEAG